MEVNFSELRHTNVKPKIATYEVCLSVIYTLSPLEHAMKVYQGKMATEALTAQKKTHSRGLRIADKKSSFLA